MATASAAVPARPVPAAGHRALGWLAAAGTVPTSCSSASGWAAARWAPASSCRWRCRSCRPRCCRSPPAPPGRARSNRGCSRWFAGHAHRRWGALLLLTVGVMSGEVVALAVQTVNAALALAGAAGVVALVRGAGARGWPAVAAAWTGSAAMFSWGLYTTAVVAAVPPFEDIAGAAGSAQLTGLLGGFALAVAGLLALTSAGAGAGREIP